MNKQDTQEILKYFIEYISYHDRAKYFHVSECFKIQISRDNEVYQLNSDHDFQGVELKTLDDFKIRFKSFTGEDYCIDTLL